MSVLQRVFPIPGGLVPPGPGKKPPLRVVRTPHLNGGQAAWDESFAEAVRPHLEPLLTKARRLLRSDDEVWDAVQETLFSLWQEEQLPPNLPAWLMKTVAHRSLHALRTRSRRRKHEKRAATERREASRRDDPARLAETNEVRSRLEEAFAELNEEQRRIFQLRELDRLGYQAIAEELQIPVGTVRSRLNRSRLAFRQILRRSLQPGEAPGGFLRSYPLSPVLGGGPG